MKNLLFIPCYNDTQNCKKLLSEIEKKYKNNFDILIINDGSSETFDYNGKNLRITIINLKRNYGIGFAIKMAINFAINHNYKKMCRIDSDGEHDPKYIQNFFSKLDKNELILGIRKINYRENFLKLLSKKIIISIINKLFNLRLNDYNCGMMGLGETSFKALKNEYFINYPEPQIILKLVTKKFKYSTVDIIQRKRYQGTSSINFFGGLDFFLVTLTFILNRVLNKDD